MSPVQEGRQVLTDEPDFIVVKAGFEYGGDLALAVVEVKKKHEKITRVDWDQALQYLRNISHKNPAPDLTVYLVTGHHILSAMPMGEEDMVPIRYQFPTLTGCSQAGGHFQSHWAVD